MAKKYKKKGLFVKKTRSLYAKSKYVKKQAKKMSGKKTWPEREFAKLLKELEVDYEEQKIIGTKIFDFYIPSINLIVEVDGDYWHGNKELFKEYNNMQKRNVKNDKFKNVLAKGMGYKIERVWESELKNNYNEVKEKIIKLLE